MQEEQCTKRGCSGFTRKSRHLKNKTYCPSCQSWNEIEGVEPPPEPAKLEEKKISNAKKYKRNIKPKSKTKAKKPKPKKIESCSDHPTYGGIRKPRKECKTCWSLYYQNNPDKAAMAQAGK